jgi:hypothetical protein
MAHPLGTAGCRTYCTRYAQHVGSVAELHDLALERSGSSENRAMGLIEGASINASMARWRPSRRADCNV